MLAVLVSAALLAATPPPTNVEARLRAGRSALAAHDYNTAKNEFTAVLAEDAGNPTAHISLGIIALLISDAQEGLRQFAAVPGDANALIGRMDCEIRLKRLTDARATADQLSKMISGNIAASEHVGTLLANAGEYATAAPFLRRASGAAALNLLGSSEENLGNLPAAVKAFGEAARLEPTNEDYRVDYAAMLLTSGKARDSAAAFEAAARDFPKSARVRTGLGSALYLAGDYKSAAAALLAAVCLQPDSRGFDLLGKSYESAGELQPDIRAEFEGYLANRPSDAAAYAHYGAILQASGGSNEKARQALLRALELNPELAQAHLGLGILEQATGDLPAALKRYERARQLEPQNAAVHYRLAGVYQKLGNPEMASAELKEFQRLKVQSAGRLQ